MSTLFYMKYRNLFSLLLVYIEIYGFSEHNIWCSSLIYKDIMTQEAIINMLCLLHLNGSEIGKIVSGSM